MIPSICPHCAEANERAPDITAADRSNFAVRHIIEHAFESGTGLRASEWSDFDVYGEVRLVDSWADAAIEARWFVANVLRPEIDAMLVGRIGIIDSVAGIEGASRALDGFGTSDLLAAVFDWLSNHYPMEREVDSN